MTEEQRARPARPASNGKKIRSEKVRNIIFPRTAEAVKPYGIKRIIDYTLREAPASIPGVMLLKRGNHVRDRNGPKTKDEGSRCRIRISIDGKQQGSCWAVNGKRPDLE